MRVVIKWDIRASKTDSTKWSGVNLGAEIVFSDEKRLATCCESIARIAAAVVCASVCWRGQLGHRHAQRQLAAEPEPECSGRGVRGRFPATLSYDFLGPAYDLLRFSTLGGER